MDENKLLQKLNDQINAVELALDDPLLCKGTANTYSRISGYYRPLKNWNNGKVQEYADRQEYVIRT